MNTAESLAGITQIVQDGLEHQSQSTIIAACIEMIVLQSQIDAMAATLFSVAKDYNVQDAVDQRSIGMALANATKLSSSKCSRIVNRASVLVRLLPEVHLAYQQGCLNTDQVDLLIRTADKTEYTEAAVHDQSVFLSWAGLEWAEFRDNVETWKIFNDQTDPTDLAEKAHSKRTFSKMQGLDGVTLLTIDMPNECFAQLNSFMSPIEEAMWDSDWAKAKDLNGDEAIYDDIERTVTQRRFDAFMQVLRRGFASTENDPAVQSVVNIVIDHATFERELAIHGGEAPKPISEADLERYRSETMQGDPVSARFAFDSAITGHIRRIVINSKTLDITVGEKSRLFTGLKRNAMIIRDRRCRAPGCETKAYRCEADHIREHSRGGTTLVTNGQMLCRPCHRHKSRLATQGIAEG